MGSRPEESETEAVDREKPQGFDKIYPRVKEVRKRILKEMYKREGEASATTLRADDGANVPRGSFEMHVEWLQGRKRDGDSHQWWPGGVPPLIKEVRREDRGNNKKTRIFGLTKYGHKLTQWMLEEEEVVSQIDPHNLRRDLETQGNRVDMLVAEIDSQGERLDMVEERLDTQQKRIRAILDHIEAIQENMEGANAN